MSDLTTMLRIPFSAPSQPLEVSESTFKCTKILISVSWGIFTLDRFDQYLGHISRDNDQHVW